jgi:hypothetical protein
MLDFLKTKVSWTQAVLVILSTWLIFGVYTLVFFVGWHGGKAIWQQRQQRSLQRDKRMARMIADEMRGVS